MNNFNWINYNNNFQLLKKLRKYNKNNKFNFIEKENYNHIRDLYCLALLIAQIKAKKLSVKVLDYGSNNLVYASLFMGFGCWMGFKVTTRRTKTLSQNIQ